MIDSKARDEREVHRIRFSNGNTKIPSLGMGSLNSCPF